MARELVGEGHAVRGTTRDPARADAIAAAGAEPFVGDPDRIATLMEAISGVTVVMWLLGSASGEAAGSLPDEVLAGGVEVVERAAATWNIPVQVLRTDPASCEAWTRDAAAAVATLLS